MPEPVKQEWHEDPKNTALCTMGEPEEDTADELVGDEVETDEWGEVKE